MVLEDVKEALLSVLSDVYHGEAPPDSTAPYVVYMEDGTSHSLYGDGCLIAQAIEGTIDLFDSAEYGTLWNQIQVSMRNHGIPFKLNLIEYETDTRLFHYEWIFDIHVVE